MLSVHSLSSTYTNFSLLGDQPQAHCDRSREEGVQLSPVEGQSDRNRHRVDRGASAGQEERMGHHGLS